MDGAKFSCSGQKIIVELPKGLDSLKDLLLFGLSFKCKDKHLLEKNYVSVSKMSNDLNEIYEDAKQQNIPIVFDPFLESLLTKVREDVEKLGDSLRNGRKIKYGHNKQIVLPKKFRPPKPFQFRSIQHIISVPHSANFSVPGSGKTSIVLAAYSCLKQKRAIDKILVIGPLSCFMAWEEEFEECFKRKPKSARISGPRQFRDSIYNNSEKYELFLASYHMLKFEEQGIEKLLKKHGFLLVLDESHHVKNFQDGLHANIVRRVGAYAKRRLILSGTPVPNSLEDIWNQFTFLWPRQDLLGTKAAFKHDVETRWDSVKERLDPLFIRINKDELRIPSPIIKRIPVELSKEHYDFYHELSRTVLANANKKTNNEERNRFYRVCMAWQLQAIDDPKRLFMSKHVIASLGRNKELMKSFYDYCENSGPKKVEFARKAVHELIKNKRKVLFWTYFVNNIKDLSCKEFATFDPLLIYGEIPKDETVDLEFNREKHIRMFKNDPKKMLLIANPAACAESISLHKVCKDAIYLDRTLNCAQYLQSMDRIHRVGITEPPHITMCIGKGTFDEEVDERLQDKMQLMLDVLDDPFKPINLETSAEDYFGDLNKRMRDETKTDIELFKESLKKSRR